jgi:hypothetical protein
MMQLALVVAVLLASVGTASAECAWVLWQRENQREARRRLGSTRKAFQGRR